MRGIEHMGYIVCQSDYNNHVTIYKDGHMVMHSQCTERKADKELRAMVHRFLDLKEKMDAADWPRRAEGMI